MALFRAVREAKTQGTENLACDRTNPAVGSSHNEEKSHGEEEKKEEIEVNGVMRAPRIGAAPSTSDFARSPISPSGRTNVRPLCFLLSTNLLSTKMGEHSRVACHLAVGKHVDDALRNLRMRRFFAR
jgi:hypothetical protein